MLLALLGAADGVIRSSRQDGRGSKRDPRASGQCCAPAEAAIYGGGAGQVFITPRVKRVVDVANEANQLKDDYISTGICSSRS